MATALDIDGQVRLFGPIVDIGADEAVVEATGIPLRDPLTIQWRTPVDGTYQPEICENIGDPAWLPAQAIITSTQAVTTVAYTNTPARAFFRLKWLR